MLLDKKTEVWRKENFVVIEILRERGNNELREMKSCAKQKAPSVTAKLSQCGVEKESEETETQMHLDAKQRRN